MAELPPEVRALFEGANFVHIATLTADGSPSSTAIWAGLEGDDVVLFTQEGSLKARNMEREAAHALADELALRYTGEPFPYKPPTSRMYVVEVDKVRSTQLPFEHKPSA